MQQGFFIAGTDTEVGKTYVTCLLVKALQQQGKSIAVSKPVSAGCDVEYQGNMVNEDAYRLFLSLKNGQVLENQQSIEDINPIAFMPPIAPHIAAEEAGATLDSTSIYQQAIAGIPKDTDVVLVEGAGGWLVPLSTKQTFADLAKQFGFPVILVVRMKLGCINHALLTIDSIKSSGLPVAGWVANCIDGNMPYLQQNIATLTQMIEAPLICTVKANQLEVSVNQLIL